VFYSCGVENIDSFCIFKIAEFLTKARARSDFSIWYTTFPKHRTVICQYYSVLKLHM